MRKDNELLICDAGWPRSVIEIEQQCGMARRKKFLRGPQKPLQGTFKDYLTDIDVSSPCERLPDDYQAFLDSDRPKYVQPGGIDVDEFRIWCENLDKDEAWIAKTEKKLF